MVTLPRRGIILGGVLKERKFGALGYLARGMTAEALTAAAELADDDLTTEPQ